MTDRSGKIAKATVNIASPGAYAVSGETGDISSPEEGLFYRDTRHLSKFVLTVNGARLVPQHVDTRSAWAEFSLAADDGEESLRVVRRRTLGDGMSEEIVFSNESRTQIEVSVSIECEADFEDIFAIRGYARASERGEVNEEALEDRLRYAYRRGGFSRGTEVRVFGDGVEPDVERGEISFRLLIGAGEERLVRVFVELEEGGEKVRGVDHPPLYAGAPELETDWMALRKSWNRSVEDLESLTFDAGDGLLVPAAGTPWFMALFGRDSLITAYQAMILSPEPARNVLRALARYQAKERDDFTDAEPGKILHELRRGEVAFFEETPETPYYGTADATPLFLILLEELWRWTGDDAFVRSLEEPARRALAWILDHSDKTNGYVAYESRSPAGLENQGWKDSEKSMLFRDGTRAETSIAPVEVQGYVYNAFVRTTVLAEKVWSDVPLAERLRSEARDLKERFDRDYWMEDPGYYALALDGDGRQVNSISSNAGHLLWSGMVPEEKARSLADRLMGDGLFSGWGIRTMAAGESGYDPNSYHNGSVWPHDNALIAEGLRRYGFRDEANRIATALIEASAHFGYRLPEVFGGHSREEGRGPVEQEISCSPQAWAAGAIPHLVRTMSGLEPTSEELWAMFTQYLPAGVRGLQLRGLGASRCQREVEV